MLNDGVWGRGRTGSIPGCVGVSRMLMLLLLPCSARVVMMMCGVLVHSRVYGCCVFRAH